MVVVNGRCKRSLLTGRSGELVEALAERRMDVACVQETRWTGSGCRFFGAIGKRY